jgi:hypothetical protein
LAVGRVYSDVTTSVELFETESAAAAYLYEQGQDFRRFSGKEIDNGVRLARAKLFEVEDIGTRPGERERWFASATGG